LSAPSDAAHGSEITEAVEAVRAAAVVLDLEANKLALCGPQLVAEERRAARSVAVGRRRKSNPERLATPKTQSLEQGKERPRMARRRVEPCFEQIPARPRHEKPRLESGNPERATPRTHH
jgi:hypothetical protein